MGERFIAFTHDLGARIGHQFSSWNTCYSLAQERGLTFAHRPFSTNESGGWRWEEYLGFGVGEVQYTDIQGRPEIQIPLLDIDTQEGKAQLEQIIRDAPDGTILHLARNQHRHDHSITVSQIQAKYQRQHPIQTLHQIALHVRRGTDLMTAQRTDPAGFKGNYIPASYFVNIAIGLRQLYGDMPVHVFSSGLVSRFISMKITFRVLERWWTRNS
jgi:hypothetical protein